MIEPYPYQQKIIDNIRGALQTGYTRPVIVSPTGSGKTIIFSYIANGAQKKGNRVLILTHRKEIMEQTLKKLFQFGVSSGQIAAGKPETNDLIQTGMVLTVGNRLNKIKKPDLIISDEHHHCVSKTWLNILNNYPDVPCLGFTATPIRMDGVGLGSVCDTMVMGPTTNNLVKEGFLSYPVMKTPPKEIIQKYHIKRGDFDAKEQEFAMSKRVIVGDVIANYKKYMNYKPCVCFCVSVAHSQLMAEAFINAGYVAVPVWGGMKKTDRERAIQGLADGSIHIITSCDVISEGVDVPVMAGAILLRKTLSLSLFLQQVGRPLRKYPGKEFAYILDHVGNYYLHGHPLTEREWSLDSKKINHKKDKPPTITRCPKCYGVWPGEPRKCPDCGFVFSDKEQIAAQQRKNPKQIEGELVDALPDNTNPEIVQNLAAFIASIQHLPAKTRQKAMIAKAFELQNREQIKALQYAVGYKKGWADFVWTKLMKNRK